MSNSLSGLVKIQTSALWSVCFFFLSGPSLFLVMGVAPTLSDSMLHVEATNWQKLEQVVLDSMPVCFLGIVWHPPWACHGWWAAWSSSMPVSVFLFLVHFPPLSISHSCSRTIFLCQPVPPCFHDLDSTILCIYHCLFIQAKLLLTDFWGSWWWCTKKPSPLRKQCVCTSFFSLA